MNLVQKILSKHLISGTAKPGSEVTIKIDQTLTQDATGTMTYLQFEAMRPTKLSTELSVSYVDHNTIQVGYENFDDHLYLKTVAQKYGIIFSPAGNGICHQVHLERFGAPGKTLLGSDSHTPTGGGIAMFAIGAGGLDIAVAMVSGTFTFTYPTVTRVVLKGKLKPWVSAKDVILKMLQLLSSKGNVDSVIEYSGPGVKTLSVPQRATIANMGAEMGVTTSVFPSDENTQKFLAAQGRQQQFEELHADADATYDKNIEINLDELEPLVAQPHNPDTIAKVSDIKNLKVNQVALGSCTNSSYQDLMTAAFMLKQRHIHPDVSFVIAPGSRQVLQMIADNGALSTFIAAGARIAETACGFCIGNSQAPGTDSVSVRTSNRNFQGRTGTPSAKVYLSSVETAIASAMTGELTDPRTLQLEFKSVSLPKKYTVDDSLFIIPKQPDPSVTIIRGPNIGAPPENSALGEEISGTVTIKVGDKITTDHIMPAGDKLKYRSNIPKYAEFVFFGVDPTFSKRALENKKKGVANIIVAGLSYGQGSSREHAAICPMYLGVKVAIAKSFERIHVANLINFGILPLTFEKEDDYNAVEANDEITIPSIRTALINKQKLLLVNKTKNREIPLKYSLTDDDIKMILAGGKLNYLQEKK